MSFAARLVEISHIICELRGWHCESFRTKRIHNTGVNFIILIFFFRFSFVNYFFQVVTALVIFYFNYFFMFGVVSLVLVLLVIVSSMWRWREQNIFFDD